jgi:ribosomal protein S24E
MVNGMNISINSKVQNPVIGRYEVEFAVFYDGPIPSRKEVREALATALSEPAERLVVVSIKSSSGSHSSLGIAHVYPTKEAALKWEKKHLLIRDGLVEKQEKKESKKAEAKK